MVFKTYDRSNGLIISIECLENDHCKGGLAQCKKNECREGKNGLYIQGNNEVNTCSL